MSATTITARRVARASGVTPGGSIRYGAGLVCSACLVVVGPLDNYCRGCGAKLVGTDR